MKTYILLTALLVSFPLGAQELLRTFTLSATGTNHVSTDLVVKPTAIHEFLYAPLDAKGASGINAQDVSRAVELTVKKAGTRYRITLPSIASDKAEIRIRIEESIPATGLTIHHTLGQGPLCLQSSARRLRTGKLRASPHRLRSSMGHVAAGIVQGQRICHGAADPHVQAGYRCLCLWSPLKAVSRQLDNRVRLLPSVLDPERSQDPPLARNVCRQAWPDPFLFSASHPRSHRPILLLSMWIEESSCRHELSAAKKPTPSAIRQAPFTMTRWCWWRTLATAFPRTAPRASALTRPQPIQWATVSSTLTNFRLDRFIARTRTQYILPPAGASSRWTKPAPSPPHRTGGL